MNHYFIYLIPFMSVLPIPENYDWLRCARFGLYGSCYVAPTLYSWLTIANIMWPGSSIRAGIIKVETLASDHFPNIVFNSHLRLIVSSCFQTFVETVTYTPFAMCSFYFGMSLLEMKPINEAAAEVEAKFWPTYKVNT